MPAQLLRADAIGAAELTVRYADGTHATVDFTELLSQRGGVFAALRERGLFARVALDADANTVTWPNGADIDPETLYQLARRAQVGTR
jgi:hypothetical protein